MLLLLVTGGAERRAGGAHPLHVSLLQTLFQILFWSQEIPEHTDTPMQTEAPQPLVDTRPPPKAGSTRGMWWLLENHLLSKYHVLAQPLLFHSTCL